MLQNEFPSIEKIYNYLKVFVQFIEFSPDCCIVALIYVQRFLSVTGSRLIQNNWRPIVFTALVIAQKVVEDKYRNNQCFTFIWMFFTTSQLNDLEQKFLELLQYNVNVSARLYARYYLELRSLFKDSEK